MIKAELVLEGGLLRSCRVSGHAGAGPEGGDVVCAAVSVLSGTVFRTLSGREGIKVRGGAPARGEFWLETFLEDPRKSELDAGFLAGAGTFLIEGLRSVAKEYPGFCQVIIEEKN